MTNDNKAELSDPENDRSEENRKELIEKLLKGESKKPEENPYTGPNSKFLT